MRARVEFGITGFDQLIPGGVYAGSCYLVQGEPGTGKTTFGLQFIWQGVNQYRQNGVVVTLEEFPEQLYRDAASFGWDFKELESQDKVRVLFTSARVCASEKGLEVIRRAVKEVNAERVYVDSVSNIKALFERESEARNAIYRLISALKGMRVTSLLATESAPGAVEEHIVDGIVRLGYEPWLTRGRIRTLEVVKSRGQYHRPGVHTFEITDDGIEVYPRLQVVDDVAEDWGKERVSVGVGGLDRLLSGGVLRGSAMLVSGATGVGKTVLGLQFLCSGASKGERGLFVSLEERPTEIMRLAAGFGFDIENAVERGLVRFLYRVPADVDFNELACAIKREFERYEIRRMVFDSVSTLAVRIPKEHQFRNMVYLLVDYAKSRGVTTLLTDETHELVGERRLTTRGISSVVDTAVIMRYVELNSRIERVLTVLKSRGTAHSRDIVFYRITNKGIEVGEVLGAVTGILQGAPVKSDIEERIIRKMRL